MALRIFDHLFVNHGWHAPSGIQTPKARVSTRGESSAVEVPAAERAEIERRSLVARLTYRCRLDPTICRATRLLLADPAVSLQQMAIELGVSEAYLSRGLRTALGVTAVHLQSLGRRGVDPLRSQSDQLVA